MLRAITQPQSKRVRKSNQRRVNYPTKKPIIKIHNMLIGKTASEAAVINA
ncbi:MAG TPA: hypothetical protein VE956_18390 [Nodularia sp. (in: cyanobacteria)]|nr:hypothetical protein [Nodularia sp. (in: cyanobacteria)]